MKKKISKRAWIAISTLICIVFTGVASVFVMNAYMITKSRKRMITADEASELEGVDCIIVLGCLVKDNGEPSDRLADRILKGVEVYKKGGAPKIIMSGDHGREDYDEVGAMKRTAVSEGVPSSDIFMDHAGFSTYESIYRAKEMFGADKIIIVTQEYHLYRALYIAEELGVEAYGVSAEFNVRALERVRCEVREVLARCKDLVMMGVKGSPAYIGEKISLDGDGNVTNDK